VGCRLGVLTLVLEIVPGNDCLKGFPSVGCWLEFLPWSTEEFLRLGPHNKVTKIRLGWLDVARRPQGLTEDHLRKRYFTTPVERHYKRLECIVVSLFTANRNAFTFVIFNRPQPNVIIIYCNSYYSTAFLRDQSLVPCCFWSIRPRCLTSLHLSDSPVIYTLMTLKCTLVLRWMRLSELSALLAECIEHLDRWMELVPADIARAGLTLSSRVKMSSLNVVLLDPRP